MSSMSDIELELTKKQILDAFKPVKKRTKDFMFDPESYRLAKSIISYLEKNIPKLKLNKPISSYITFKKEIEDIDTIGLNPNDNIKSKIINFTDTFAKEIKKIKITDTQITENQTSWEDASKQEIEIVIQQVPSLNLKFLSQVTMDNLINFKTNILKAVDRIKTSPISKLHKAVTGDLIIATDKDIQKEYGIKKTKTAIAFYSQNHQIVVYYIDETQNVDKREIYISLIHEFGHKFHDKFMKAGFGSTAVKVLYLEAMKSTEQCYLDQLPKIGDPLSNLREDWWTVRMSSEDYVLTEIQKSNLGIKYVYTNTEGKTMQIDKKDILKLITCPSQYGAKNELEFFAEMVTLITLGLVKPSQQVIADKFMDIINKYSI